MAHFDGILYRMAVDVAELRRWMEDYRARRMAERLREEMVLL